jgi:hypothetical protein
MASTVRHIIAVRISCVRGFIFFANIFPELSPVRETEPWNMTPCCLVETYRRSRGSYRLRHHGRHFAFKKYRATRRHAV